MKPSVFKGGASRERMGEEMILIFSDVHLHCRQEASLVASGELNSKLKEQIEIARQIRTIADEYGAKHIWFLGDMIESLADEISDQVYQAARIITQLLAEKSEFWFVTGNHDVWGKLTMRAKLASIPKVHIIDQTTRAIIEGKEVDFVPWDKPLPKRKASILAGHLMVYGSYVGPSSAFSCKTGIAEHDLVHPQQLEGYDYIFLGHNHHPQDLSIPGVKEARYVGSLMPTSSVTHRSPGSVYLFDNGRIFHVELEWP